MVVLHIDFEALPVQVAFERHRGSLHRVGIVVAFARFSIPVRPVATKRGGRFNAVEVDKGLCSFVGVEHTLNRVIAVLGVSHTLFAVFTRTVVGLHRDAVAAVRNIVELLVDVEALLIAFHTIILHLLTASLECPSRTGIAVEVRVYDIGFRHIDPFVFVGINSDVAHSRNVWVAHRRDRNAGRAFCFCCHESIAGHRCRSRVRTTPCHITIGCFGGKDDCRQLMGLTHAQT